MPSSRCSPARSPRARQLDRRIWVAVADASGQIVGLLGCDGAPRISRQVAQDKAFTAAVTGMPTSAWKAYVESIPASEREIIARHDGYIGSRRRLPDLRRRAARGRDRGLGREPGGGRRHRARGPGRDRSSLAGPRRGLTLRGNRGRSASPRCARRTPGHPAMRRLPERRVRPGWLSPRARAGRARGAARARAR